MTKTKTQTKNKKYTDKQMQFVIITFLIKLLINVIRNKLKTFEIKIFIFFFFTVLLFPPKKIVKFKFPGTKNYLKTKLKIKKIKINF